MTGAPIRDINMRVEIFFHQLNRGAFEVSPFVHIRETCRCDLGAGGKATQRSYFRSLKGPVNGKELIVLVLAHSQIPQRRTKIILLSKAKFFGKTPRISA